MITIDKFHQLTSDLIGQSLTQITDSYGDVIILHFGNLTNYTHSKLSHLTKGEYQLVIKMSNYGCSCLNSTLDITTLLNQELKHIDIGEDLQLILAFNNRTDLDIIPNDETELPYWELWIPGDSYIVVDVNGLQLVNKHE